jgi:excisionase family DNA binding protein
MSRHLETPQYDADRLERLLTISDLARLLRVSRGSVYSLIRRGELVPVRVGERARFIPAEVRMYLDRRRDQKRAAATEESRSPDWSTR